MQVILREDVAHLGRTGDIVDRLGRDPRFPPDASRVEKGGDVATRRLDEGPQELEIASALEVVKPDRGIASDGQ